MQKSDFEKGREAYLLADDNATINATSEFMDGYRHEWHRNEGGQYERWGDNAADRAFDAHCEQIHLQFRERTSPPPAKRTPHQFIINSLAGTAALLLFAGLIAACLLLENNEISAWMYGGVQ